MWKKLLAIACLVAALSSTASARNEFEVDMDLTLIKLRVMNELGWSSEKADVVIAEYKKFWVLHKKNPGQYIVPSIDVDEVWHAHILHTHKYMTESLRYFGHFFHHWPEDPRETHDNSGYEATLKAYKEAFGSEPNAVWVGDKPASKDGAGCGSKCGALDSNTDTAAKSETSDKKAGCGSKCGAKMASSDAKAGCGGGKCGGKCKGASDVKAGCGGGKCGGKCKGMSSKPESEFTAQPAKCGSRCGASRCGGKSSEADPNAEARVAAYLKKVALAAENKGMNCSSCGGSSCSGSSCTGGGMGMSMRTSFAWFQDTVVLWDGWRTDTDGKYAGTIIAILVIMLVKEALFHKRVEIARHGVNGGAQGPAVGASATAPSTGAVGGGLSATWKLRLINAVLGAINLTLGYFIMLIVMTYNNGFFIAIILGGALAQFLFSVPWTETAHADGAVEVDCCEQ